MRPKTRSTLIPNPIKTIHSNKPHRAIAAVFKAYLKTLVEASDLQSPLQFTSSITTMPPSETFTPHSLPPTSPLIFNPTTPLFYALLARQNNLSSFLNTTLTNQALDPKKSIVYTSNPTLLLHLFNNATNPLKDSLPLHSSRIESPRWRLIHRLRKQHLSILSPLDAFAMASHNVDAQKRRAYRLATLKLLLSDYVAFGIPAVIDAVLFVTRMWLCWVCVRSFDNFFGLRDDFVQVTPYLLCKVVLSCVGLPLWAGVGALL